MKELWNTWRNVAWSVGSGWGTPSAITDPSCEKKVADFPVNACHQSRCTCSAPRFYCQRRNACTMGWWHRTCGPNQEMCYFAVPLHSSHHWVHEPQHGLPETCLAMYAKHGNKSGWWRLHKSYLMWPLRSHDAVKMFGPLLAAGCDWPTEETVVWPPVKQIKMQTFFKLIVSVLQLCIYIYIYN